MQAGHSQQPEQSTAAERRRESARRNRKRKADYLVRLEDENTLLRCVPALPWCCILLHFN